MIEVFCCCCCCSFRQPTLYGRWEMEDGGPAISFNEEKYTQRTNIFFFMYLFLCLRENCAKLEQFMRMNGFCL